MPWIAYAAKSAVAPARTAPIVHGERLSTPRPMTTRPATTATAERPRNTESGLSFSAGKITPMPVVMTALAALAAAICHASAAQSRSTAAAMSVNGTAKAAMRMHWARSSRAKTRRAGIRVPGIDRSTAVAVNW
jgi:hypothetical protein